MSATLEDNKAFNQPEQHRSPEVRSQNRPSLAAQEIFRSAMEYLQPLTPGAASMLTDDQIRASFLRYASLLNDADAQVRTLLEAIFRSNVRDHRTTSAFDLDKAINQNTDRIYQQIPTMEVDWSCLDRLSGSELYQTGLKLLRFAVWQHSVRVDKMGELLVEAGIAGRVFSFNQENTVLRFNRSRILFNDAVIDERTVSQTATSTERFEETFTYGTQTVDKTTTKTTTDVRTDTTLEVHQHDVVNAHQVPLSAADNLPYRIEALRRSNLPTLQSATKVLYGDLIKHQQEDEFLTSQQQQVVSETISRKVTAKNTQGLTERGKAKRRREKDPGVLLGGPSGYVLAGWLPDDID